MDENSLGVSAIEDLSNFIQFINMSGDISKTLYLATHPEESDESPSSDVFAKASGNEDSAHEGTVDGLPTAA
jgi:hypothetical protein